MTPNCHNRPEFTVRQWGKSAPVDLSAFKCLVICCQATINGVRQRVFLDQLPESAGRYSDEPPIVCGLLCNQEAA